MSWRTVIVSNQCKLSYKNNHLIVRKEDVSMIHLSEINLIIIESTQVSITSYLLSELASKKIKLIICDEQRNPISEMIPYYGSHNTSKKILQQINWDNYIKNEVWAKIVRNKIHNQAINLQIIENENANKLLEYEEQVEPADISNREGHAAKVYFNSMFGKDFSRDKDELDINSALNYGYMILLSAFSREIVSKGYITQLGINHKNEFNNFNLACDFMEPFRTLVDLIVFKNKNKVFDRDFKYMLVNVFNCKIKIDGKEQFVSNAIGIYVKSIFKALEENNCNLVLNYEFV